MKDELDQLEKIDLVAHRTGLDFTSSRFLLEENDWDLLQALTVFESEKKDEQKQLVNKIKGVINQANETKIVVKGQQKVVAKLPATLGILGAIVAPKLALLGAATCLISRCSLELKKSADLDNSDDLEFIDN